MGTLHEFPEGNVQLEVAQMAVERKRAAAICKGERKSRAYGARNIQESGLNGGDMSLDSFSDLEEKLTVWEGREDQGHA